MQTLDKLNPTRAEAAGVLAYPYIVVDLSFGFSLYHNHNLTLGCHMQYCMITFRQLHGFETEREALDWIIDQLNSPQRYDQYRESTLAKMWVRYLRKRGFAVGGTYYTLDRYPQRAAAINAIAQKHSRLLFYDDPEWRTGLPGRPTRPPAPLSPSNGPQEALERLRAAYPDHVVTLVDDAAAATHAVNPKDGLPRDLRLRTTYVPKKAIFVNMVKIPVAARQ